MPEGLRLLPRHRRVLTELIRRHLPGVEVWAYGSRVSGRSHGGSDLDLVLRGPGLAEMPVRQMGEFRDAVHDSTIPFTVEARDWTRLPESFRCEIERCHIVMVEADRSESPDVQSPARSDESCRPPMGQSDG